MRPFERSVQYNDRIASVSTLMCLKIENVSVHAWEFSQCVITLADKTEARTKEDKPELKQEKNIKTGSQENQPTSHRRIWGSNLTKLEN